MKSNSLDKKELDPLHIQAETYIRQLIEKEEYKAGKLLPTEVELAKMLNISRNTLRQAINKLVYEGLLLRKRGHGTRVVRKGIVGGVKNWLSFSQEMKMLGIEVKILNCISAIQMLRRRFLIFLCLKRRRNPNAC